MSRSLLLTIVRSTAAVPSLAGTAQPARFLKNVFKRWPLRRGSFQARKEALADQPNRVPTFDRFHLHKEQTMKIFFLNNDGGGFADQIDVAEGTTLGQLFEQRMPGSDPHNYLIRVN